MTKLKSWLASLVLASLQTLALAGLLAGPVAAQTGQLAPGQVWGNFGTGQSVAQPTLVQPLLPSVAIESQAGGGCASADNTAALIAAANSVAGAVKVRFGQNCTYHFTQTNAINFTKPVYIECVSSATSALDYAPTADGTFIQWSNGVNVIFGAGLKSCKIQSSDTTRAKVMVNWYDVSGMQIDDVLCTGIIGGGGTELTGGTGSACFYSHGRDTSTFSRITTNAQIAFHIGMNPHSYISTDHYHFSDLHIIGDIGSGTNPLIQVDPGVVFTSTTFDGFQAWVGGGSHSLNYVDTAATHNVNSVAAGGSGYTVGQILTVAGGTCSTPIQIQVLTLSGSAVASASIANPGVCSVTPGNPVSVTTGSATFNVGLVSGYRLAFNNVRSEQGISAASYTFNIQPKNQLQGLLINNTIMDPSRCGVFLKNTIFETVKDSSMAAAGACGIAVNATAANGNDMLNYVDNFWPTGVTHVITGMTAVHFDSSPTGTSPSVPPSALYSSSISGATFNNLGIAASSVFAGSSSGTVTVQAPSAAGTGSATWPSGGTYNIVGDNVTQTLTNKTFTCANNVCNVRINADVSGLGTGVPAALGLNIGSAGAPVVFNGAGGTPSSIVLTNGTGLPVSTGVSGLGTGVATAAGTATNTNGGIATQATQTPTITDGSGASLALTVTQEGYQVGNMVHQLVSVTYPTTASGATAQLNGLAVTVPNRASAAQCFITRGNAGFDMFIQPIINTKNILMFTNGGAAITNANLSTFTFSFECVYPAT